MEHINDIFLYPQADSNIIPIGGRCLVKLKTRLVHRRVVCPKRARTAVWVTCSLIGMIGPRIKTRQINLMDGKTPLLLNDLPDDGKDWKVHYALFAQSGFTPAAKAEMQKKAGFLVDLKTIDSALSKP